MLKRYIFSGQKPTLVTVITMAVVPICLFVISDNDAGSGSGSGYWNQIILSVAFVVLAFVIIRLLMQFGRSDATLAFATALSTIFIGLPFLWASAFVTFSGEGQCLANAKTKADILYFSYITATTTGYGDIYPLGVCRIISVLNALTSLFGVGILISLATRTAGGAQE